jgi:hypothetical protein
MGEIHSYAEGIEKPVIRAIEETGPASTVLRTPIAEQAAGSTPGRLAGTTMRIKHGKTGKHQQRNRKLSQEAI